MAITEAQNELEQKMLALGKAHEILAEHRYRSGSREVRKLAKALAGGNPALKRLVPPPYDTVQGGRMSNANTRIAHNGEEIEHLRGFMAGYIFWKEGPVDDVLDRADLKLHIQVRQCHGELLHMDSEYYELDMEEAHALRDMLTGYCDEEPEDSLMADVLRVTENYIVHRSDRTALID